MSSTPPAVPAAQHQHGDAEHLWSGFVRGVALLLAASGLFIFGYNYYNDTQQIEESSLKRARAHFRDMLLAWQWNSNHGGVYSAVGPQEGANEFPEFPDLQDADGNSYRLRHPDQMAREIADLARLDGEHRFRITSLKPKNPQNAPDTWEAQALTRLGEGLQEVHAIVRDAGRIEFRYMAPMLTEKSCLQCHSEQVYRIAGIHGGISIRFDISDLTRANHRHQIAMGLVTLLTLGLVLFGTRLASRRLDNKLRQFDRRYEDLLQSTESIVWEAQPDSLQLTFISDQVERLLGFQPAECLGPDFWFQRIHPQDAARVWEELQAYRDPQQPLRLEYRMTDRYGRQVWMQSAVVLAEPEDGPPVLRGVMLDISERKLSEQRVQDMFAEQYAILQNALVGIAYMRRGRIVSCNARFEEIFGAARASLVGRPVRTLYPSEDAYLEVRQRVEHAFTTGDRFNTELLMMRRDGSIFWGAMNGQRLDAEDPARGAIWIYADISERKAAQAALTEHQAKLEQLVEQRTAELRRALDAAHAADRAKDDFLANVSHEMRTPLNAVIGLSDLARRHSHDPQEQGYLGKIVGAGQTLLQIINDLLDLSKIAAGHLELEAIPFRLADITSQLDTLVTQRLQDKPLQYALEIDHSLPPVLIGDPLRVAQIITNLVGNAFKFTDHGGVTVRLRRYDAGANHVGLAIEVEDTGCGMTPEEMTHLFQPFSQAHHSIARTHGGTGLGLSICRRFATMMHGDIQATSTPGSGTTFTVRLVLDEADAATRAALLDTCPAAAANIRYRDTRILVADDQPINRQIARELLAEVGIDCDEVANGREAVEAVTRHPAGHYALVLMDVQMPEMDGHDATRALRTHDEFANLPIIAMTAFAMVHERRACLAAGMNDHLGKPFDPIHLYALLARWLPLEHQHRAAPAPEPETPTAAADAEWIIAGIDTQAGIERFAGNRAAYQGWLEKFAAEGAAPLDDVKNTLAAGDRTAALRILHTFKGRCGMLGMTALWQSIVALEAALKEERDAAHLWGDARQHMDAVLVSLGEALS